MATVHVVHFAEDYYAFSTEETALDFVHTQGCVVTPIVSAEDQTLLYWSIVDGEDYETEYGTMTRPLDMDSGIGG